MADRASGGSHRPGPASHRSHSSTPNAGLPSPTPSYDRLQRIPLRPGSRTGPSRTPSYSQPSTPSGLKREFSFTPLVVDEERPTKVFEREPPQSPVMASYTWWRLKRLATRPLPWAIFIVVGLITWWSAGASTEFDSEDVQTRLRELFPPEFTRELQFFPASNRKIHVSKVGAETDEEAWSELHCGSLADSDAVRWQMDDRAESTKNR